MVICIFGDSITWGTSDSEKGGWVERLKVYFGEKYDIDVYNLGVFPEMLPRIYWGELRMNQKFKSQT